MGWPADSCTKLEDVAVCILSPHFFPSGSVKANGRRAGLWEGGHAMTEGQMIVSFVIALVVFGTRQLPWQSRNHGGDATESPYNRPFFVAPGGLLGVFALIFLWWG